MSIGEPYTPNLDQEFSGWKTEARVSILIGQPL
jgi:hypothetical protein